MRTGSASSQRELSVLPVRATPAVSAETRYAATTWSTRSSTRTGSRCRRRVPAVGGGEVLEVVDDPLEDHRLLVQGAEQGRVGLDEAVPGDLQPAADVGEGAAQFVRDVADHGLALGLHAFPAFGEVVERLGQDARLVPGPHRHPDVQLRWLLGRFGQGTQGAYESRGDDGRHQDRERQYGRRRADDLGLVRRGDVEAGCGGVPAAQEEFGHRRDVGGELGAAGVVGAGLRLAYVGRVTQFVVLARDIAGAEALVGGVDPEVRDLEAQAVPRHAGLGAHDQALQRLALGGGRGVELPVGAHLGHVAVRVVAVRVVEDGAAARRHRDGRVDAVLGEARLPFLGQPRQPDPLLRGQPVRSDDPGVETAELRAGFRVRVGVQGVDAGGGAGRQGGAVPCGVRDEGAVGGREGDAASPSSSTVRGRRVRRPSTRGASRRIR